MIQLPKAAAGQDDIYADIYIIFLIDLQIVGMMYANRSPVSIIQDK